MLSGTGATWELTEKNILRSTPDSQNQKFWGLAKHLSFNKDFNRFWYTQKLKNHWSHDSKQLLHKFSLKKMWSLTGLLWQCCCCLVTEVMSDSVMTPPWTIACQVPLSIGFPRQEYWSGLPCPPPGDLPNPGIEPECPAWQVDSLHWDTWEAATAP